MADKRKSFHESVAENLIRQLEQGTAPWQRPWEPGDSGSLVPINPVTGKCYKGINALLLMAQERNDQRWMTYNQSVSLGGQVLKGERGTGIQYWKFTDEFIKKDGQGKPVLDDAGHPVKVLVKLERPRVFYATVFNADQIEGLPPLQKKEQTWDAIERAEAILAKSGAVIRHNISGKAYYRPSTDNIHLPEKSQFPSADKFYATALHELGHWTGHSSRLDRDLAHPFGSEGYAKEELRAEIASMLLGDALGIGHDPGQHAAYVGSWIKVLQDDPLEIFRAAADAEKIQDYVLSLEHQHIQDQGVEQASNPINPESPMPMTTSVAKPATLSAYQTELARLLKLSTLTPGDYLPSDAAKNTSHAAVFAGDSPVILCGDSDNLASVDQAQALAASPFVIHLLNELKPIGGLSSGIVEGTNVQWQAIESAVVFKLSGKLEFGGESGAFVAVVLNDPSHALTTRLCVTTETARLFDPDAPDLDNGKVLPALASIEDKEMALRVQSPLFANKTYLAVPYSERKAAKAAGALWDKAAKSWYAGDKADKQILKKWLPDQGTVQQSPAQSPRDEFAEAMSSIGCLVTNDHPVMDGKTHRIATTGDKPHEKAGFYVGYLDGHPGGYIENNRTGESVKWKAKGYSLSEAEKAQLLAQCANKQLERSVAQKTQQDRVARSVRALLAIAPLASSDHPYLQSKQVRPGDLQVVPEDGSKLSANAAILIGKDRIKSKALREAYPDKLVFTTGDLLLAAQDIQGEIRSVQTIQANGLKRFAAGGEKQDTFHVVGGKGLDALEKSPVIVISEGYATADSLSQSLGYPTVAAFDAGNLLNVARLLHDKFLDKPFIIAGDNDLHLEMTEGRNPGKEKAIAAAKAVNGLAVFPIFAPGEQAYPANLEPVTPDKARNEELSDEQKAAIRQMKSFTDFNDLATKSVLGVGGVERQVTIIVNSLIVRNQKPNIVRHQHESDVKLEPQSVQRKAVII